MTGSFSDKVSSNPAHELAPGLRVEWHGCVTSTSTLAFERAKEGEKGPLWIVAEQQSSGRGRRGRDWASEKGNLFASLLLTDKFPSERLGQLPLMAAVALAEAVDQAVGSHHLVRLKWPNDLLIGDAKLSGILVEAQSCSPTELAVVLGFGVNCAHHPDLSLYASTDLASEGYQVTPEQLFAPLSRSVASWLNIWLGADGFAPVRREWKARAAHIGQDVTIRNGGRDMSGIFRDLDSQGHLILETSDGTRETIMAGDVFPLGMQQHGAVS